MRNHPDQSHLAARLSIPSRIDWATGVSIDFVDIYAVPRGDRDLIARIVALEDRRFFTHHGVDWKGISREFWNFIRQKEFYGASTITMQLVRIASGDFSLSLTRKIVEVLAARKVDSSQRKWRILMAYYETAYLGSGVLDWDDLARKLQPHFAMHGGVSYEILASCLASPMPLEPSPEWIKRTLSRADRIALAVSLFPLAPDHQRIIINNIKHVPIKGVRLSV